VTLVDSPGVSEEGQIRGILSDYVKNNDPFGFIFTLDCSRGGGLLPKVFFKIIFFL
jgi:hypothetical protein